MIATESELMRLLPEIRDAPWVAVDTEADSLHAYPEKLCLLQISLPGRDELLDPLAGLDFLPLLQVLHGHRLILHGADYDLRLLHRTYRFVPSSLFDTMLAARLLGYGELGLDKLVGRIVGVPLEKGPQRANWARRPLTERMANYARNDTHHLKPLCDRLTAELAAAGRAAWHEEMCRRLIRDAVSDPGPDPDEVWRLGGAHRLDRRGLSVLRELWRWRDGEAVRTGRPPFFLLGHDALVALAEAAARGANLSSQVPRHWSSARWKGAETAIEHALSLPEAQWPRHRRKTGVRLSAAQRNLHLDLQKRRDAAAAQLRIDPSLIASRATLVSLAGGRMDPASDLMRWQRDLLGL